MSLGFQRRGDGRTDERTHGRLDGQTVERTDGCTRGRTDRRSDVRRTNGLVSRMTQVWVFPLVAVARREIVVNDGQHCTRIVDRCRNCPRTYDGTAKKRHFAIVWRILADPFEAFLHQGCGERKRERGEGGGRATDRPSDERAFERGSDRAIERGIERSSDRPREPSND